MRRSSARLRDLAITVAVAVSLVLVPSGQEAAADHRCSPYGQTPRVVRGSTSVGWSVSPLPRSWQFRIAPAGTRAWVVVASGSGGQPYETNWNTVPFRNGLYDIDLSFVVGSRTHDTCLLGYHQISNLPTAPAPVVVSPPRNSQDVFDASWGTSTAGSGIDFYEYAIDCNTSRIATAAGKGARLTGQAIVRGSSHYLCVRGVDRTGVRGPFAYSAYFTYTFLSPSIGPLLAADPATVQAPYPMSVVLLDPSGRPLAGKQIRFFASWGAAAYVLTDAAGRAAVTLPGPVRPGGYDIYATFYSDGTYATAQINRRISAAPDTTAPGVPTSVVVSPSSSATNAFRASWSASSDTGSGLAGYEWRVDGGPVAREIATSTATFSAPAGPGGHTFEVRAVDRAGNRSAFAGAAFELRPSATTLTFTQAPTSVTRCSPIDLATRLTISATPLAGRAVSLRIGGSGMTAMTDVSGIASASIPFEGAPGQYTVSASYAGDAVVPPSQATRTIQVTGDPSTPCRPTGGGPPPGGGPGGGPALGGSGRGGLSVDIPPR